MTNLTPVGRLSEALANALAAGLPEEVAREARAAIAETAQLEPGTAAEREALVRLIESMCHPYVGAEIRKRLREVIPDALLRRFDITHKAGSQGAAQPKTICGQGAAHSTRDNPSAAVAALVATARREAREQALREAAEIARTLDPVSWANPGQWKNAGAHIANTILGMTQFPAPAQQAPEQPHDKRLVWIIENTTQVRVRDLALDILNHPKPAAQACLDEKAAPQDGMASGNNNPDPRPKEG